MKRKILYCLAGALFGLLGALCVILCIEGYRGAIHFGESPEWSDPPTVEDYIAHGFKWAECNRRIRDQEYTAGAWYRTEDPNVTVYLDLVEQEGWDAPELYYSASDPNATIWIYRQLLANTSGAPIRWGGYHVVLRHGPYDFPKTDPNDYAKFLDKKIKFYDGVKEYDISREAPVTVR